MQERVTTLAQLTLRPQSFSSWAVFFPLYLSLFSRIKIYLEQCTKFFSKKKSTFMASAYNRLQRSTRGRAWFEIIQSRASFALYSVIESRFYLVQMYKTQLQKKPLSWLQCMIDYNAEARLIRNHSIICVVCSVQWKHLHQRLHTWKVQPIKEKNKTT